MAYVHDKVLEQMSSDNSNRSLPQPFATDFTVASEALLSANRKSSINIPSRRYSMEAEDPSALDILPVGVSAFAHLCHGMATGDWKPLLETLASDVIMTIPLGEFKGELKGKAKAGEYFAHLSALYPEGLHIVLESVTSNDKTVVFEYTGIGRLRGQEQKHRSMLALDVREKSVSSFRSYFGWPGEGHC